LRGLRLGLRARLARRLCVVPGVVRGLYRVGDGVAYNAEVLCAVENERGGGCVCHDCGWMGSSSDSGSDSQ
jgi:hypothetical protein